MFHLHPCTGRARALRPPCSVARLDPACPSCKKNLEISPYCHVAIWLTLSLAWSYGSHFGSAVQQDLSDNPISGRLENLPSVLYELRLRNASISGVISEIQLPPGLEILDLSYNSISGSISPEWWRQLPTKLTTLYLGEPQLGLQGVPGTATSGCTATTTLADCAGSNKLEGSLPANSFLPPDLTELELDHNSLSGQLPAWDVAAIQSMDLRLDACLHACLPACIGLLTCQAVRLACWRHGN